MEVTRASGDQGVDILAEKGEIKYAIQCKNYSSPLNNKPIQEVTTGKAVYGCDIGVVLTNSTFNDSAIEAANAGETITLLQNITLTEGLVIAADKEITLDLNGKTVESTTKKAFEIHIFLY